MVNARLILAIVAACGIGALAQRVTAGVSSTKVSSTKPAPLVATPVAIAAQDSTGQIWGHRWRRDEFFRWSGKSWNKYPFAPAAGAELSELRRQSDGAVLGVWIYSANVSYEAPREHLLSEHRGQTSRVLARWKTISNGSIQIHRTRRATWVTTGRDIFRLQNGAMKRVYSLGRAQMHSASAPAETLEDSVNDLEVLEDSRGRTWFWSNEMTSGFSALSLRGALVFDGQWTHHARFAGVADKPLTALVQRDARTFWLAVGNQGLFELDAQTLKGRRAPEPVPHAWHQVQRLVRLNGAWHLIGLSPERHAPGDYSLAQSDLWRWNPASGAWTRLMRGLDRGGWFTERARRPLLETPQGTWIGAISGGAWWLPRSSTGASSTKPLHINWRRGFNLSDVNGLFRQNDGRILAFGASAGSAPDLRAYLSVDETFSPRGFTNYGGIETDARGHLWRVASSRAKSLLEWDGAKWKPHPLPANFNFVGLFYLWPDTRGRIWVLPDDSKQTTALYSPSTRHWQIFPTFSHALQAQLRTLGPQEFAKLKIGSGSYLKPHFAAPSRITFRSPTERICYFDGRGWREWKLREVTGQNTDADSWEEGPFFARDGVLSANIEGETYRFAGGKWQKTEGQSEENPLRPAPTPTPPPECKISDARSVVKDRSGAIWIAKDGQLFKSAWGLCAPQLAPNERHPLRDGRGLEEVLIDARGEAILMTGPYWEAEFVAFAPKFQPETRLQLVRNSGDTWEFGMSTNAKSKHWFRWRLDKGNWSAPQTSTKLKLEWVPSGAHQLEAATIDERLQIDATPASVHFKNQSASNQQIARFLEMLRSPDYAEREAAVVAFSKQPQRALPVLRAARVKADADTRWWIDAAIEEIERRRSVAPENVGS